MPLDPDLARTLDALAALNAPPLSAGTPEAARANLRFLTSMRRPDQIVAVKDVDDVEVPGPAGPLAARVYRPEHAGPTPTVVFAHGGGFVIGDLDTHDNQVRAICAGADATVLAVDYRLAPEAPWPAAVEDVIAAVRWAAAQVGDLGGDPGRLAVAGDSAGGNLAAVAAQQCRDLEPPLAAQLLIYPATDLSADEDYPSRVDNAEGYFLTADDMIWFSGNYIDEAADRTDPRLSPLRASDLSGLPPAVVATAEFDPLRDEGAAYAAALRAAGVEVDEVCCAGMVHGFFDMGLVSAGAQAATDDVIARFRALLWR